MNPLSKKIISSALIIALLTAIFVKYDQIYYKTIAFISGPIRFLIGDEIVAGFISVILSYLVLPVVLVALSILLLFKIWKLL